MEVIDQHICSLLSMRLWIAPADSCWMKPTDPVFGPTPKASHHATVPNPCFLFHVIPETKARALLWTKKGTIIKAALYPKHPTPRTGQERENQSITRIRASSATLVETAPTHGRRIRFPIIARAANPVSGMGSNGTYTTRLVHEQVISWLFNVTYAWCQSCGDLHTMLVFITAGDVSQVVVEDWIRYIIHGVCHGWDWAFSFALADHNGLVEGKVDLQCL